MDPTNNVRDFYTRTGTTKLKQITSYHMIILEISSPELIHLFFCTYLKINTWSVVVLYVTNEKKFEMITERD